MSSAVSPASALTRISKERLSALLLTAPAEETVAVVDVRDSDHIGGHIRGSRHVASTTLHHAMPELARALQRSERVVFHCALSQERGPAAALKYIRERERLFGPGAVDRAAAWTAPPTPKERDEAGAVKAQEVYVLTGGFVEWQEK